MPNKNTGANAGGPRQLAFVVARNDARLQRGQLSFGKRQIGHMQRLAEVLPAAPKVGKENSVGAEAIQPFFAPDLFPFLEQTLILTPAVTAAVFSVSPFSLAKRTRFDSVYVCFIPRQ